MQTFLPYSDFEKSAESLDKKRCWKQVVEVKQIICTLRMGNLPQEWKESKDYINQKFINHPAVQMWVGDEKFLKYYYNIFLQCCLEKWKINTKLNYLTIIWYSTEKLKFNLPFWLGNEQFHRAMRSRLIEKDEQFYLPQFPEDKGYNDGKYWWPEMKTKTFKII